MKKLTSLIFLIENIDASSLEAKIMRYRSLFDEHKDDEVSEVLEEIRDALREAALELSQQLAQIEIDSISSKLNKIIPGSIRDPIVNIVHEELMKGVENTKDSYNELLQGILNHPQFIMKEIDAYSKDILFGREKE